MGQSSSGAPNGIVRLFTKNGDIIEGQITPDGNLNGFGVKFSGH